MTILYMCLNLLTKIRILLPDEDVVKITPDICKRAYERFIDSTPEEREEYRRLEHERWMRFYRMFNWTYSPKRNNELRQHNLLVPYEKLSKEEQLKDDSAWEILNEALV